MKMYGEGEVKLNDQHNLHLGKETPEATLDRRLGPTARMNVVEREKYLTLKN
jgi:hypothetical protein